MVLMLHNCRIDERRSLKIALQEEILNHLELLYPKDRVVSVKEKDRVIFYQVRNRKKNASEPSKKSRKCLEDVKIRNNVYPERGVADTCLRAAWHPGLRWLDSISGDSTEHERLNQ